MPAVLILAADEGVLAQQELTAARVSPHHHAVIQRSQTTTVLVVWRSSQLQECLQRDGGVENKDLRCNNHRLHHSHRRFKLYFNPSQKTKLQLIKILVKRQ